MSDTEADYVKSGSQSPKAQSRSRSRSRSASVASRKSRTPKRSYSRSRSRSYRRSKSKSASPRRSRRTRSRSPYKRNGSARRSRGYSRSRSRSRSRSYSRGRDSHGRSPMSERKRHVGDRLNPPTSKCLGVFGLSLYTTESDLRSVMSRYGRLSSINIVIDQKTGRSRGFGFVYYENDDDAADAKERANGMELDGRRIRVDFSITKRPHTPTPGVYVGRPYSRPPARGEYGGGGSRYGREDRHGGGDRRDDYRRDDYRGGRDSYRRSPSPYSRRRSPSPYSRRRSPSPYSRRRSPSPYSRRY